MLSKIRNQISLAAVLVTTVLTAAPAIAVAPPSKIPGGKITGRLIDRNTRQPLAGEVGLSFAAKGKIIFQHAQSTKEGEFVFDGIEADKVHLATKLEGYAVEHQTVSLRPVGTTPVEFSLVKPRLLRGTVRDAAGRPLHGATVKVLYDTPAPERGEILTSYQWEAGETRTDAQGGFQIPVHPDKGIVVEASHPDFLKTFSAPRPTKALAKEPTVDLVLESGVTLAGTVKDGAGNPIQGAQVRLIDAGPGRDIPGFVSHSLLEQRLRVAASGADGTFRFDQVSPSAKTVVILQPGYKPFRQAANLTSNKAQSPFRAVLERQN